MPGARWFPGGTLNYAEHALAAVAESRPDDVAIVARSQTREPAEITWAAPGRRRGALPGRAAAASASDAAIASRRTCPTSPRRSSRSSPPRAWARCGRRARPSSASARWSTASRRSSRRCSSRSTATATARRSSTSAPTSRPSRRRCRRCATPCTSRTSATGADDWSALLAEPGPLEFEPVPFDHPLYVLYSSGTTGLPEGDRARARRHHRRAPQDRRAAPRPRRRRPVLLVHHHRLDDVELPRVRPAGRRDASCCSTATPASPTSATLWRARRRHRRRRVRRERAVPHGVPQGRRACRPPHRLRSVGSTGAPLPPDGFRWVRDVVGPHVQTALGERRHRRVRRVRRRGPAAPGARGRDQLSRSSASRSRRSTPDGQPCPPGVQGELVVTEPMPSMPVGFWGDPDRREAARTRTTTTTRACGATATGSPSPTTARA